MFFWLPFVRSQQALRVRGLSAQAVAWRHRRTTLARRRQRQVEWARTFQASKYGSSNAIDVASGVGSGVASVKSRAVANAQGGGHEKAEAAEGAEGAAAAAAVEEEPPPVGWSPRDVACLRLLVALVCDASARPRPFITQHNIGGAQMSLQTKTIIRACARSVS